MTVIKMSLYKMTVDRMPLDEMTVDIMPWCAANTGETEERQKTEVWQIVWDGLTDFRSNDNFSNDKMEELKGADYVRTIIE